MAKDPIEEAKARLYKKINEETDRTHRAFRTAFTFIKRLQQDNEIYEIKIRNLQNEIKDLRDMVKNLTRIGDN